MRLTKLAGAALLVTVTAGCSTDAEPETDPGQPISRTASASATQSNSPAPSSTPTPPATDTPSPTEVAGPELVVRIEGDDVSPNNESIELEIGEKLTIRFETDRPGELHVHSRPEQFVEFKAGRSVQTLVVDSPGVVEVEEHDTSHVVASLEVR